VRAGEQHNLGHSGRLTAADVRRVRQLVRAGTPASKIAAVLGRTVSATRQIALTNGISLCAAKRAAVRRRK
jgi:hypothetical protein